MDRTNQLTQDTLSQLLAEHEPPCISIYMPTARHHPEIAGQPILFKNLLRKAEEELASHMVTRDLHPLTEQLHALIDDRQFWNHQLDGLAVFRSADHLSILRLPRAVPQVVVVAETFYTKPLVRILQTSGRYQVLCISQRNVSLYEGDRTQIHEIQLHDVPRHIGDANLYDIDNGNVFRLPEATAIFHGKLGDPHEQQDVVPLERFFRIIDIAITNQHSRPSGLPLILAAVDEYHALFRTMSKNPALLEEGIRLNPDGVQADRLRDEAWRIVEPYYHERTRRLIDDFHVARARDAAAEDVAQVAEAAAFGRVAALLVDADKQIGGHVDRATGKVEFKPITDPAADDLLDDTAECVLKTGGHVMVVPHELMPTDTGVAAIYRY